MTECGGWVDENGQRHACSRDYLASVCGCSIRSTIALRKRISRQRKLERDVTEGIKNRRPIADPFAGFRD